MTWDHVLGAALAGAIGESYWLFCRWYWRREDARIAAQKAAGSYPVRDPNEPIRYRLPRLRRTA